MLKSMADHVREVRAYGGPRFKPEVTPRARFFFPNGNAPCLDPLAMRLPTKAGES
jgi:hypothetical protein